MLVLTRRPGEAILIGGEIQVIVLESTPGCVRIGVKAPRHVPILRQELVALVGSENQQAVTSRLHPSVLSSVHPSPSPQP